MMLKLSIALLTVASIACGIQYDGLRVKFGWSEAMSDKTHFFNIPRLLKDVEALGWKRTNQALPFLPELRMYCPPGRAVCPLYDSAGFVAGLQVALPKDQFQHLHFRPEKKMTFWLPRDDETGLPDTEYWATTQYFVSEESLSNGAGPTVVNGETLQDGGVWVPGSDGRLMRIPSTEAELNSTLYKKQNCIPNMGTHYYYNMTPALACERMEPWFALVSDGELVGTGFQVLGRLRRQDHRQWFENVEAPKQSAQITIPLGPPCIYDWADEEGVTSLHIYYIDKPWTLICRTGDSIKQAPFMDRLLLNSWRYATKISDQFKHLFNGIPNQHNQLAVNYCTVYARSYKMTGIGFKASYVMNDSGKKEGKKLEVFIVRSVKRTWSCLPLFTSKPLDYEVIPVFATDYGVFYTNDCYIIINREGKHATIHYWLGKNIQEHHPPWVSPEEFGLYLKPNMHLEVQDDECELFVSYFKSYRPAIQYMKGWYGNITSTRFFRLDKIAKDYRLREIDLKLSLMTKEDAFIMDTYSITRAYISDRVTSEDRQMTINLLYHIRHTHHNGGGVDIVELKTPQTEDQRGKSNT